MYNLKALASSLITRTPIQYFPVTVQKELAQELEWSASISHTTVLRC